MKRLLSFFSICIVMFCSHAQTLVREHRAVSLDHRVPAGNYSGITPLGGGLYAVVDDKAANDGFYVWHIDIDAETGQVKQVQNLGFRHDGAPNRDAEGCAFLPQAFTVLVSGERDNSIVEYTLDGKATGRRTLNLVPGARSNGGLEALTYDAIRHQLWTMEEAVPSLEKSKGRLRLLELDTDLQTRTIRYYPLAPPTAAAQTGATHVHGVSAICALNDADGTLLVLEREAFIPKSKIGAWAKCRIVAVRPDDLLNVPPAATSAVSQTNNSDAFPVLWEETTHMRLFQQTFANYEGLCFGPRLSDGSQTLLLLSDSQNRYAGILKDYLKVLVVK